MAEVLERNGNKVKFKVTVPAPDVTEAFQGVFNALSGQVKVPGFRPGKAPRQVLEKRVGKDYVHSEVREQLLNRAYPKAVKELELIPVSADVTPGELNEGQEFEFTVDAENYPEVSLNQWRNIKLTAESPKVSDEDLEKTLENLRDARATHETVERAAEATDLVDVEIIGGEDAGENYPVYLERADENVRNAILGQNANAEVTVKTGETDSMQVRIKAVKEKRLPELNDEFAKSLGEFENVAALRERVSQDLAVRAEQQGKENKRNEFVDHVIEGMNVDVPQSMIERRRHAMEHDLDEDLKRQGANLPSYREYLKSQGEDKLHEFENGLAANSLKAVKRDLALEKLTEELSVKLEETEWKTALENYARSNNISVPRLLEAMGQEGLENFRVLVTRDKALDQAIAALG